jgi:SOS-response transcriptional repressor LexA
MSSPGGAFSWNSELPNGHSPFWINDDALAGLGLHVGDAVSVDTSVEPHDGDLVVVEAEIDGDSLRLARRLFHAGERLRLEGTSGNDDHEILEIDAAAVIVMGVIVARLQFSANGDKATEAAL